MTWGLKHFWKAGGGWKAHIILSQKAWEEVGKYCLGIVIIL